MNSNCAQQILKSVDEAFKSFFALNTLVKEEKYPADAVKIPHYLPKDGFYSYVIGQIRLKETTFDIPMSSAFKRQFGKVTINIPANLLRKVIKEIRIIPRMNARFFEVQYVYESQELQRELDKNNVLAIDLGLDNLATCVTSKGQTFIIDGMRLKAINQWYNKENSRLQAEKDKQGIKGTTNKQAQLALNRNNRVKDYTHKAAKKIIDYCLANNIGTLVVGCNRDLQTCTNLDRVNNQNFVNIPLGEFRKNLAYRCKTNGIAYIEQEESYTSKASFLDNDPIPVYEKANQGNYGFSGKRISRGQYKSATGIVLNADVNGAFNILRKSKLADLTVLQGSGDLFTPLRIRIA